jgi:hypothetical protein
MRRLEKMILVYATGEPGFLEFATTRNRGSLPTGAKVLAIADDERTTELLGENTFSRMTDEEYYELRGLINQMQQSGQS